MGTKFPKFTVAAVQAASIVYDREKTTEKAIALIEEAADGGADVVVLPESFIPGYPYHIWLGSPMWYHHLFKEWFLNSVEIPSREVDALCDVARRKNCYVVVGITEREGNTCYNTLLFIDRKGDLLGKHRKLMPTHVERVHWGMGDGSDLKVFQTDIGRLSGLICWEHTMDLVRHTLLAMKEQVHCACWVGFSNVKGWENLFNMSTELAARYHAHVGECFVINVQSTADKQVVEKMCETEYQAQWFKEGGGWTAIIAPGGGIISGPLTDREGILYAEVDLEAIADMAHWHDATGHYARPDVASLLVNLKPYKVMRALEPRLADVKEELPVHAQLGTLNQVLDQLQTLRAVIEAAENSQLLPLIDSISKELQKVVKVGV